MALWGVFERPGVAVYPGNSLSGIQTAIVGDISGLKAHPNGWQVVEER